MNTVWAAMMFVGGGATRGPGLFHGGDGDAYVSSQPCGASLVYVRLSSRG